MQHLPYRNDPEKGKIVIDFMRHIQSRERGDCAPPPSALSRQPSRAHPAARPPRAQTPLDGHGAGESAAHGRGGGGFGSGSGSGGGGLSTPPSSAVR